MSVAVQMGTRNQRHYGTQVYVVVIRVNTLRTWTSLSLGRDALTGYQGGNQNI